MVSTRRIFFFLAIAIAGAGLVLIAIFLSNAKPDDRLLTGAVIAAALSTGCVLAGMIATCRKARDRAIRPFQSAPETMPGSTLLTKTPPRSGRSEG